MSETNRVQEPGEGLVGERAQHRVEWGPHPGRAPGVDTPEPHLMSLLRVDWGGRWKAIGAPGNSLCKGTEVCGESGASGSHIKFKGSAGN